MATEAALKGQGRKKYLTLTCTVMKIIVLCFHILK